MPSRVRALEAGPTEVHILEFASEQALAEFQNDPARLALARLALAPLRERAIARTVRGGFGRYLRSRLWSPALPAALWRVILSVGASD